MYQLMVVAGGRVMMTGRRGVGDGGGVGRDNISGRETKWHLN